MRVKRRLQDAREARKTHKLRFVRRAYSAQPPGSERNSDKGVLYRNDASANLVNWRRAAVSWCLCLCGRHYASNRRRGRCNGRPSEETAPVEHSLLHLVDHAMLAHDGGSLLTAVLQAPGL